MDSKALKTFLAMAPTDDKALIDLLLESHATRLRHTRESASAERSSYWSIRSLFSGEDGAAFSPSRFWGEVA